MSVEIRPVAGGRDLRRFIALPYEIYRNEPRWIPPLRMEERKRLDRTRNPFFSHAAAEYFLAWRDWRPVGRITAHIDHRFNEFQDNDWGMFGFFECEDSRESAHALLDAAAAWLRERGRDVMLGPMDFTTNDECGLLIEGHERPPVILSTWHHPSYQALLEAEEGFEKAMDLLMWSLHISGRGRVRDAIWRMASFAEREHGIVCRPMRKRDLDAEVSKFLEVYNAAWERNWGSVPLTEEEVRHYAKDLRPVLDENLAYLAERADTGEVVGAALTLPDFNQVLAHLGGRLLPIGWAKALYWRRRIDAVRVFALGVKPAYQHTGVAARFYQLMFDAAERTPQKGGEMGWILETNRPMNRAMEGMGGEIVRRFRIYQRSLV
ncbi:MAG: GNAT family N-acetyltransferase [Solirubrobacteraceae bacterium]